MKPLVVAAACAVLALLGVSAQAKELKEYPSEASAQAHCPKAVVVWSEVKGGASSMSRARRATASRGMAAISAARRRSGRAGANSASRSEPDATASPCLGALGSAISTPS